MASRKRSRFRSRLVYEDALPAPSRFGRSAVLVYDAVLARRLPGFRAWSRRFPAAIGVRAGERLKSLEGFGRLVSRVLPAVARLPRANLTIVAVGGGSVGDAAGFLASTLKRGVRLVLIPSTWLAAADSAHGGKNALNAGGAKNQIGTFWPAESVHLVRRLLDAQPEARAVEALAEVAKIALTDGGPWIRGLRPGPAPRTLVWATLRHAVGAKYRVVLRDPYERLGPRRVLNFGHTLGHAIESFHGLPHGKAIGLGLRFAVDWSEERRLLAAREAAGIRRWLAGLGLDFRRPRPIPESELARLIRQDKKGSGPNRVRFVFLRARGTPRVEQVLVDDLVAEAVRQGFADGGKPARPRGAR